MGCGIADDERTLKQYQAFSIPSGTVREMKSCEPASLTRMVVVALRSLGIDPAEVTAVEPLRGGISGASVFRVVLERALPGGGVSSRRRVVKWLLPSDGWLGVASSDVRIRELALRSSGLLDDLPRNVATATEAWALEGTREMPSAGALLLRDERGHLVRAPLRTPAGRIPRAVASLLDRLARMHARFWEDARLGDPRLGLAPTSAALLLTSPGSVREARAAGDANPYLPLAATGWEAFFRLASPEDGDLLRQVLDAPGLWVTAIERQPRTLVHGDVWGPNLGWLPATRHAPRACRRLLLLDWALATAGPATYDPLWLCGTGHGLDPMRTLATYRARLTRHLAARGIPLDPVTWRALADAGYLRTALTCGEALGRSASDAAAGAAWRRAEARVRWWAGRAAVAARRLVSG